MKSKRFFYHYYKQYGCMSVYFNKTCTKVDDVVCEVTSNTKWNKTQPRLVIQGFCKEVVIVANKEDGRTIAYIK